MINETEHYEHIIACLNDIIVYRKIDSIRHIQYVKGYTGILAAEYGKLHPKARMTPERIEWIVEAAGLHDIGKIMMPDSILGREGRLSKAESELLKEHTIKGSEMIELLFDFKGKDFCRICRNVCLFHHERYDGSGYPRGYKRDKIPTEAQLVALADMYEVLIHYERDGLSYSKEKVYYMLMNGECGSLSPNMRGCLESAKEEIEQFRIQGEEPANSSKV